MLLPEAASLPRRDDRFGHGSSTRMAKSTSVKASGRKPRSRQRDRRVEKGIALAAAAVLGQVFQWRPGLARTPTRLREPAPFDVQAVFDALNKR